MGEDGSVWGRAGEQGREKWETLGWEGVASLRALSGLLGGSWVVIKSRVIISALKWGVRAIATLLIPPLITTHEPPSTATETSRLCFRSFKAERLFSEDCWVGV